jgi:hypothetical protein
MSVTRQQVVAALDGLRHGRQGHTWRAYVRSLLRQHGGGAVDIDHLPPKYFESVWRAAGGAADARSRGLPKPAPRSIGPWKCSGRGELNVV